MVPIHSKSKIRGKNCRFLSIIRGKSSLGLLLSFSHAPSTINWISAFSEFNRYMAIFRKFFESKRKCKCLIIITLPFWLVPRLFARFESFSSECIIPLDFNEFLSVRYIVSIALQSYTFFTENVQNELIFWIYIKKKLVFFLFRRKFVILQPKLR